MIISKDLNVKVEVLPLLADVIDKRTMGEDEHEEVDLIVGGWALFSDIYIRD